MKSKIRKLLAVLAAVALLCTVLPLSGIVTLLAAQTNLVINGDFESGNITGWISGSGSEEVSATTDYAYTGTYGASVPTRAQTFTAYQDITVEMNTDYEITFWYISDGATGTTEALRDMVFAVWETNGTNAGAATQITSPVTLPYTQTSWTKVTVNLNSGSYTTVRLGFGSMSGSGQANYLHVDDIVMTKVEAEPEVPDIPVVGDNLLANGDFETGAITPWSSQSSQKCAISSNAHIGSYGATVPHRNTVYTAQQDITVEVDTDYVVTLWYKSTNVSTANQMRVCVATTSSTNTAQHIAYTDLDSTKGTWTKVVFTFNSGSNTSVRLGIGGIATPAATETYLCVDDIVVAKKEVVEPSFDGYITNGDFETGDLTGWNLKYSGDAVITSTEVASGSYALQGKRNNKYSQFVSQTITVEANTDYVITFKAKLAASGGQARLYISPDGDHNNKINPDKYYFDANHTAWQTFQIPFNSGANTTLVIHPAQGVTDGGDVFYDDITMEKATSGYQGTAQKDKTTGADIRMMTYNVLVDKDLANGGYDWSSETATIDVRAPKAIAMIKYYQPDVIALEEFSGNWYTYFRNDLTDYAFAETASLDSQNNGLLYTTLVYNTKTVRLLDTELHGLTNTRWGKQGMRYVNVGFFEVIATGEKFIACATHTDAGSLTGTSDVNGDGVAAEGDGYWRQFQTAEIAEILNELSTTHKMPVLCGGDYNCSGEETASYSKLTEAGLTDSTSGRYIDHIFYNSMVTHLYDVTVTDALVAAPAASDHNAVFGDFQFLDEYATPISQLMSGIKQQGRNYMKNGVLWLDFSASGIEFTANCEGDVAVNFVTNSIKNTDATYGGVYFTVIVDGVQKERAQCRITATGNTTLTIAEDLPAGNHTFEIYRQTEHRGAEVGIGSIVMNGTIGTKPSDNTFFIEFIGDSISTGYGALGVSGNEQADSPKWQDATAAYPYLTAKALGVDFSDVCYSGIGAKYGWQDPNMHTFYPYQRYQYDRTTQYNFTNREPNLIVIALGTNDIAMETEKGITVEQRLTGYQEFLDLVRAKNPNSKIIWIYNMMKSDDNTRIAELIETNGGAAEGLYSLQLTQNTAGAGWHPSAAGQKKFADELVAFINANNLLTLGDEEDTEGLITAESSSVMDIVDGKMGVGFLFDVKVSGITKNEAHIGDYTNATVTIDGVEYKLIKMGAVVTNRVTIGVDEEQMKLTNPEIGSGSGKVLDIFAEKVYEAGADNAKFAVRIKNIPEAHRGTVIYARPYYVIEKDGEEVTVYADIVGRSYDEKLDVNDDEFEWDD